MISRCYIPYKIRDVSCSIQYLGEFLILCRWLVLESVISHNTALAWFSITETLCVVWSWRTGGPSCSWLSVSRLLGSFISNRRILKNDSNCNKQHYYKRASDFHIQCKLQLTLCVSMLLWTAADLNSKLRKILYPGNSAFRLMTWDHWNWTLNGKNVKLKNNGGFIVPWVYIHLPSYADTLKTSHNIFTD